jgi:DNA-binding MarR family transcriptional regulator
VRTAVSSSDLAEASIHVLRTFAAIADASLDATEPRLSLQQFRALSVLHERGPLQATRLALALGIAPSTSTRLADRLVRDGLVVRVADATDRRAVLLRASRKGARTAERVKDWRLAELGRRFADVPSAERPALLDGLQRLGDALTASPVPPTERSSSR